MTALLVIGKVGVDARGTEREPERNPVADAVGYGTHGDELLRVLEVQPALLKADDLECCRADDDRREYVLFGESPSSEREGLEPDVPRTPPPGPDPVVSPADIQALLCSPFPDNECPALFAIEACESQNGTDPNAYRVEASNGGRLQINRDAWADYFAAGFGWSWSEIVFDDDINRKAGFEIWRLAGGSWRDWSCRP